MKDGFLSKPPEIEKAKTTKQKNYKKILFNSFNYVFI